MFSSDNIRKQEIISFDSEVRPQRGLWRSLFIEYPKFNEIERNMHVLLLYILRVTTIIGEIWRDLIRSSVQNKRLDFHIRNPSIRGLLGIICLNFRFVRVEYFSTFMNIYRHYSSAQPASLSSPPVNTPNKNTIALAPNLMPNPLYS